MAILAEGNITTGQINTSGNVVSPVLASGLITIASAPVLKLQSTITPQNTWNLSYSTLQSLIPYGGSASTAACPGNTVLNVSSMQGISTGNTLYIDPLGPNAEIVTVKSVSGNTITLDSPVTMYHAQSERLFVAATTVVVNAGAGSADPVALIPITTNGSIFAPDPASLNNGTITIGGQIQGCGNVIIKTGGSVLVNSSIGLTQNPTAATIPADWIGYPSINIVGNTGVTVMSGVTVSSEIAGCVLCPNSVNIATASLSNNGLITGGAAGSATFSNAFVSIAGSGDLTVAGTGNFTVPGCSVIEVAAADNHSLNLKGQLTFNTGAGSLVIFDAQASGGTINMAAGIAETITGGPVVSINTPNLTLNSGAQFTATGASSFAIGSGFTADPLTVTIAGGGTSTITTGAGGTIGMRSSDGQNIHIAALTPATLVFSGSNAILATSGAGTTTIDSNVTIASGSFSKVVNPAGSILGTAFQPFVGGPLSTAGTYVGFGAYPYQVVLALLGPIAGTQQFQYLSTYTQQYSNAYVIQAAKQVGMRVSAGVFVKIQVDGTILPSDQAVANLDIQLSLAGAAKYGNLMDIVVGNEDIVGGDHPAPSINTLSSLVSQVKTLRDSTISPITHTAYSSTTLPVTTRQIAGVLNLVKGNTDPTSGPAMIALAKNVEQYIYGNYYPFFNEDTVVPALIANPNMSQGDFQSLVNKYMTDTFTINANNFVQYVQTGIPNIRVGETGWATPLLGYAGSSLPQQNTTWAGWYYPAMQQWSISCPNPLIATRIGVNIGGYFDSYNEPWKGINGGAPGGVAQSLMAAVSPSNTPVTISTCCTNPFPTLTPMSLLINPGGANQEIQNINSINGNNLTMGQILYAHSSIETINAGTPEEPFFGIWVASGNSLADGSTYTLTGITQKYSLPVYPQGQPPPTVSSPLPSLTYAGRTGRFAFNLGANTSATDVQIGTRIATDYTPSALPQQNDFESQHTPLSGVVSEFAHNPMNAALVTRTEFSTEDLATLASLGVSGVPAGAGAPGSSGAFFNLDRGSAVFTPDKDIVVRTHEGDVHISRGSVVQVNETGADVCVLNLDDRRKGAVKVVCGEKVVTLQPGKELVLTRVREPVFEQVNPTSRIATRNVRKLELGRGITGFICDFSIPSALTCVTPLKKLIGSSDPHDRQLAHSLLKNAILINDFSGAAEPYKASTR